MLLLHPLTTTHLHSRLYTDPLSALSAPPSFLELNATSPQAPLPTLVPTLIPILVSTTCGVLTTYNKRVPYTIKGVYPDNMIRQHVDSDKCSPFPPFVALCQWFCSDRHLPKVANMRFARFRLPELSGLAVIMQRSNCDPP